MVESNLGGDKTVDTVTGRELAMEATVNYYKQQTTRSDFLEVRYCGGNAWLKGVQMALQGKIPGERMQCVDTLGRRQTIGWHPPAAPFLGKGARMLAGTSGSWCQFSVLCCHKL